MAGNVVGSAEYQLGADLKPLRKDLSAAEAQIKKSGATAERAFGKQATGAANRFGVAQNTLIKQSSALKKGIMAGVGLGGGLIAFTAMTRAIGAVGDSIGKAAAFQDEMTKSIAIMGDVSAETRVELEKTARTVATETRFSAEQAAEAYYFLTSAGLDAEQQLAAMPKVAEFATAGQFDLALATDLLTDAQSALGLSIKDDVVQNMENMTRVSDVLVRANTLANASVQQFSESLTNRGAAALRLVGKELEEGVAVLAAWADQGVKGAEAGTRLDIVLRDLQNAALKNADVWADYNVAVFDSNGEMRDLVVIIEELEAAFGSLSDEQLRAALNQLGFTSKSVQATASLLGTSQAIREYRRQLDQAGGVTGDVADKQLTSFSAQMDLLRSTLDDASISIGERLIPHVQRLGEVLREDVIPELERAIEFTDLFSGDPDVMGTLDFFLPTMLEKRADAITKLGEEYDVAAEKAMEMAQALKYVLLNDGDDAFFQALRVSLGAAEESERRLALATHYRREASEEAAEQMETEKVAAEELEVALDLLADRGLKGVASEAREATKALRALLAGPDREKKQIGELEKQLRANIRLRRQASREGQLDAFAEADANIERIRTQLQLARTGRRANRERLQQFRAQRRARRQAAREAAEQAEAEKAQRKKQREDLGTIQTELGVTKDKALELYEAAGKDIDIAINTARANEKLDALHAKLASLKDTEIYVSIAERGGRAGGGGGTVLKNEIRDMGGPVTADEPYWIGLNRKPELFVPETNGRILTERQVASLIGGPSQPLNATATARPAPNITVHITTGSFLGFPEDAQRLGRQLTPVIRRELDRLALHP